MSPALALPVALRPGALSRMRCCLRFSSSSSCLRALSYSTSSLSFVIARRREPADWKAETTEDSAGEVGSSSCKIIPCGFGRALEAGEPLGWVAGASECVVLELSLIGSRDEVDTRSGKFCSKWRLRSSERWGREGPSCEVVGICRGEALPGVEGLFIWSGRTVCVVADSGETPGGLLFEVEVERCRAKRGARDIRKPSDCTSVLTETLPLFAT